MRRAIDDPRVRAMAPDLSLRMLFALLETARSLISLDTGPAHAAAALGCPATVLAGKADPRRHEPVGAPGSVRVVTALPRDRWPVSPAEWWRLHDIADIEVSAVLSAWQELTRRSALCSAAR
jgi:heptosyltransferase-2/heptosyltransferase-3